MGAPAEVHAPPAEEVGGPYARYVLVVLALVYVFNFVDRQILSIPSWPSTSRPTCASPTSPPPPLG
jgi:hypothetical protein